METSRKKPQPRKYSLFEKVNGKWTRISQFAFYKQTAVSHWQGQLIAGSFSGRHLELRPVKS